MFLCLGTTPTAQRSLTFKSLTLNDVNRATEVSDYASGKSINVARVLKTLGHSPLCTGFLGGPRGRLIRDDLTSLQIDHDFIQVPTPTRLCTTVIDLSNHTATELVEESAPVPESAWPALDAKVAQLAPTTKTAILSGSLPPGAPQDAYARWTATLRAAGTQVILDARGESARKALSSVGLVLKMNLFELSQTLQMEQLRIDDLKPAMLRALPPNGVVIITCGRDGAYATNGSQFFHATPPPITPVSAVGSGDAFAAGLAAALHLPLPQALQFASACGAANALTPLAGTLYREDADRLLPQTTVSPL